MRLAFYASSLSVALLLGVLVSPWVAPVLRVVVGERDVECYQRVCIGASEQSALSHLRGYPPRRGGFVGLACEEPPPGDLLFFPDYLGRTCGSSRYRLMFSNPIERISIEISDGKVNRIVKIPIMTMDF